MTIANICKKDRHPTPRAECLWNSIGYVTLLAGVFQNDSLLPNKKTASGRLALKPYITDNVPTN